jgi:hypothetical protein
VTLEVAKMAAEPVRRYAPLRLASIRDFVILEDEDPEVTPPPATPTEARAPPVPSAARDVRMTADLRVPPTLNDGLISASCRSSPRPGRRCIADTEPTQQAGRPRPASD